MCISYQRHRYPLNLYIFGSGIKNGETSKWKKISPTPRGGAAPRGKIWLVIYQTKANLTVAEKKGDYILFDAETTEGLEVVGQPRAKQVFYDLNGKLTASYYVEVKLAQLENPLDSHDFSFVINNAGKVLFSKNLVSHAV